MSRLIKGIALAFFATVLPCLGWAVLPEPAWTWDGIGGTKQSETVSSGAPIYLVNGKVYNLGKYNIPSNNFTFSFWAKYQQIANWKSYIGFANSDGSVGFQDNQNGSLAGYGTDFDDTNRPLINLDASAYSLVTIVSENGTGRIYINGAESKTFAVPTWASSEEAMTYFALGGESGTGGGLTQNRNCDTYLADVRVYDVALTAEQVGELYAGEYTNMSLQADSDEMVFGEPQETAGDPTAARLSERSTRDIASTAFNSGIEGITATAQKYTKTLTSGGEYTRTLLTYTNTTENEIEIPGLTVDDANVFKGIAVGSIEQRGNTDGAVLTAETSDGAQTWFAVEHPFTRYTLSAGDHLRKALSFTEAKTTYTIADLSNISTPGSNKGTVGMGVLYIPITVNAEQTSVILTLQYTDGSWAALFGDVDIYDANGFFVKTHEQEVTKTGSPGTYITTIEGLTAGATYLLAVQSGADYDDWGSSGGTSNGSITLTGATAVDGDYTLFLDKTASTETYVSLSSRGTTDASSTTQTYNHDDIADYVLEVPIQITDPDNVQLTVKYVPGTSHGVDILGLDLYTEKGIHICHVDHDGFAGGSPRNSTITIPELDASYTDSVLIAVLKLVESGGTGSHTGTVVCSGAEPTTGYLPKGCLVPKKTTYTNDDVENVLKSSPTVYAHGIFDVAVKINATTFSAKMQYTGGNARAEIYNVELIDPLTGELIATATPSEGSYSGFATVGVSGCYTGTGHAPTHSFTVDEALVGTTALVRFYVGREHTTNTSRGNISVTNTNATIVAAVCPTPSPVTGVVPLEEKTLAPGESITFSYVTGKATDPEQFRRVYNEYLNAERAHPHRVLPHYNSWYDLCINRNGNAVAGRFTEAEALASMRAFREELWEKRGVSIDSYLWDDGWDNWNSLWDFNDNFQPQGFSNLADEAHKVPGASIAAWLSPLGGYGSAFTGRVNYAKSKGYIPQDATGLDMSAETYYNAFRDRVLQMITDYDMNLFKFDHMGKPNVPAPTGVADGYNPQLMAVGNLCAEMRVAKPDVFINATVGTWASPYWLMWADSIWRGENDVGHYGSGTSRQKWITYRDNIMYDRIVAPGNLLPLNSLMMHGIVVCNSTGVTSVDLQASTSSTVDFASEVWMGMTLGTGLQEYYITPSLMTDTWWDILAEGVKYVKANEAIFTDAHWIGGDPSAGIYGYASLGERKGIITLRNPTSGTLPITSSLDDWLEMPEALKGRGFTTKMIYNSTAEFENAADTTDDFAIPDAVTAAEATTATSATWSLPAYATVVFEVNFENENEVVIDANTYATFSEWRTNTGVTISTQNVILDFSNITEAKTFTFDEALATAGKLYIVGEQTAQATVAVAEGVTQVFGVQGVSIETSITTSAAALNAFMIPSITSGVVVTVDVPEAATLSVTPTGSGEWVKTGTGTLTLDDATDVGIYKTAITIEQGAVIVSDAAQFVEMVAVDLGATLTVGAATTFSDLLAMNGSMAVNAATRLDGNLSVSSFATIGGTATITQNCNVQVSKGASLLVNNPITLGKTITKSGLGAITYFGAISSGDNAYGLTVNAGTVTLKGENTYNGKTTIAEGATVIAASTADNGDDTDGAATWDFANATTDLEIEVNGTLEFQSTKPCYRAITGAGNVIINGNVILANSGSNDSKTVGLSQFTGTLTVNADKVLKLKRWANDYAITLESLVLNGTITRANNGRADPATITTSALSGNGTIASVTTGSDVRKVNLVLTAGATIDATNGAITTDCDVALPTGALNVKLAEAPTVTAPAVILGKSGLDVGDVADTTTLALTIGETAGVAGYKLVTTTAGYAVAEDAGVVTTEAELNTAVTAVTEDTTITLGNTITLEETLVIDIGDANTLTLNLAGHSIATTNITAIKVVSGRLNLIGTGSVYSLFGTNAITVDGTDSSTNPMLNIGADVTVTSNGAGTVYVGQGTVGGLGEIVNGLALGTNATIDASEGPIRLTGTTAPLTFPSPVEQGGEMQKGILHVILPEDTTGFPARFIYCTGATATDADSVTLLAQRKGDGDTWAYNDKVHVMTDITTGLADGYGVMQYVCVDEGGEKYMSIAEALRAGATSITLFEDTTENVIIPNGVTLQLGLMGAYTVHGNVTIEGGATLMPLGGSINGNLVFEDNSRLTLSMEFGAGEGFPFTVTGAVTFPTASFTITADTSAETVNLGVPRQLIKSGMLLTPGTVYTITDLDVITGGTTVPTNENTKIVTTSTTYELVTTTTGPCSFDGVDYASIQQALDAYYTEGNQTLTLNELAELTETIVIDVGEGNTVTMDLTGYGIMSSADPAIRIESGNLALINNGDDATTVWATTGTAILVGASDDAGTASATDCGLYIGTKVTAYASAQGAKAVNVVNGGVSGEGTITGNLTLGNGTMVDATHGVLTMAEGSTITFPAEVAGTGVDKDGKVVTYYTNNTIQVMTLAGSAYPSLFINCPEATASAIANTTVEVVIDGMEVTSEDFTLEVKYADDQTTVTGYAVDGDGYAALAVVGDEMTPHKEFANAVAKAGSEGTVILLQPVTIVADLETNIYTGGQNVIIDGARTLTGTLTVAHGTIITANNALTATRIVVEPNAIVTFGGIFTPANPIEISGTVQGHATINAKCILKDGACIAGIFSPTDGTEVEEGATVSVSGQLSSLSGDLLVNNATINGDGNISIEAGNTLTGAGTIHPKVTLADGATINKVGYEANHLVIPNFALGDAANVVTVKAGALANVINTKATEIFAENFTVQMTGDYELYDEEQVTYTNTIVLPVVTQNNDGDYVLGLTKMNLVLNGVNIGGELGAGLATYGYQHGFLEVKGISNPNTFQLFSGVSMTGFTSGGYAIIDEDSFEFGVTGITVVVDGSSNKQILVTATVIAANGNERTVDYRTGTTVVVTDENGTAIGAVPVTEANAATYGATVTDLPGVKYFIVPYADLFEDAEGPSITKQFKVKATNE